MMMPSTALPTGPYDWHPEMLPRAIYEARLSDLRAAMAERGVTHAVVHGNILDHGALTGLTHFTPKLGPAYALVPKDGPVRLLFSGGPGMKPSAQRLTWVEDLAALRGVEGDVKRWLGETGGSAPVRLGLAEGSAMLRGDWQAVQRAAGGAAVDMDGACQDLRARKCIEEMALARRAADVLRVAVDRLIAAASSGTDQRHAVLSMEEAAFAAGAQDVRVRIGRRAWGPPTTVADGARQMDGPTRVALAVRVSGMWADARFVIGPVPDAMRSQAREALGACLACVKAGAPVAAAREAARAGVRVTGNGIGLSLAEPPDLAEPADGDVFRSRSVISLAVEVPVADGATAAWSVLVALDEHGEHVLWSPPELLT